MMDFDPDMVGPAGSVEEPPLPLQEEEQPEHNLELLNMIVAHQQNTYPGDVTEHEKIAVERCVRAGIEDVREFKSGNFRCLIRQISRAELLEISLGAWELMNKSDDLFEKIWDKNISEDDLSPTEKRMLLHYNLKKSIYMVYISMKDFDKTLKIISDEEGEREAINHLRKMPHIFDLIRVVKDMNGISEESARRVSRFLSHRGSRRDNR